MASKKVAPIFLWAVAAPTLLFLLIYFALPQIYLYTENKNFEVLREKSTLNCNTMPLHCFVRDDNLDGINNYLASGHTPEQIDNWGRTALHFALVWQKLDAFQLLLVAGADPDAVDASGVSILYEALSSGQLVAADALLAGGADINGLNHQEKQETALHYCVMANDSGCVAWLVQNGAATNVKDAFGYTVRERIEVHTHIDPAIAERIHSFTG